MLSICIPTYNRLPFLEWTVSKTLHDFPNAKLIVSDNASTDGTNRFKFPGRYIRQPQNIGAFPNLRAVLLASNTKYCTYLGDDDYLLPDEVQKGIDFLEANPTVAAYFAPVQLYNEVEQKVAWDAYYVATDTTFERPDTLWNFVIQNHVWPEHAIWRRTWLDHIMKPRLRAYWCFIDLAAAFAQGPVHFASRPFYRNLTGHPMGDRVKLGDQQCLTDFDEYRSGLENMAYDLFKGPTPAELPLELRQAINSGIQGFIKTRVEVAHRLLVANKRYAEAESYAKRLMVM
jgi:glycosyltransferase involved in cell wall biosynthesis